MGIPTYREADSIGHVVRQVDEGLRRFAESGKGVIVNVDGDSPDATAEAFLATPTAFPKVSIAGGRPGGKGANLLRFFRYCEDNEVDVLATVDGDLVSIEPEWVSQLLSPLVFGNAQFVAPLYRRSRFEASITNHFAYPLVSAGLGISVRQPIGGEFGLSRDFLRYVLAQPVSSEASRYGIDIFLTLHAGGGGFRIAQASLGRKVHKPTFSKMRPMFFEVVSTALDLLARYPLRLEGKENDESGRDAIDEDTEFTGRDECRELFVEMRRLATAASCAGDFWPGVDAARLRAAVEQPVPAVAPEVWVDVLSSAMVEAARGRGAERRIAIVRELEPLFFLRALTFWRETEIWKADRVENELREQVISLRQALYSRTLSRETRASE